jgi:hypothetical protein
MIGRAEPLTQISLDVAVVLLGMKCREVLAVIKVETAGVASCVPCPMILFEGSGDDQAASAAGRQQRATGGRGEAATRPNCANSNTCHWLNKPETAHPNPRHSPDGSQR